MDKEIIKEALEYYNIKNIDYQEKCNRCIDEIKNNKKIQNKAKEIYEILYIDKTEKFRELWKEKDIEILFEEKINPFITNILLFFIAFFKSSFIFVTKSILSHPIIKQHIFYLPFCYYFFLLYNYFSCCFF